MNDYDIAELERSHSEIIINKQIEYKKAFNASSPIYILEISSENDIIKKYSIMDEEFYVYSDGENIILTHPRWSLSGIGTSLIDAERNLLFEVKDILRHYSVPNSELTPDAIELKEFLQRLS